MNDDEPGLVNPLERPGFLSFTPLLAPTTILIAILNSKRETEKELVGDGHPRIVVRARLAGD